MTFNPFPGLRPFESDEDHLFFGRESDIDTLLGRLRADRFLAVVGTSGSGKSSLVRCGLIPALQSGYMAGAGSTWHIVLFRPGEDPIGNLALAASAPDALGVDPELGDTQRVLIDATLRRGTLGLVNAVRQARIDPEHNVLVLVDQFEELFRFRRGRNAASRDEAIAFVRLLLEAASQQERRIYVVITMRSDFIGDCMDFPGLAEAVSTGLYLVGRMSRDSLRSVITGPVAVARGKITPRLVNRVLNDLGDDHDQLPLVQHALMRTWDHWSRNQQDDRPIDIEDYEAVGGITDALSRHAEEAYRDAVDAVDAPSVERVFKLLSDTYSDTRGVRRPSPVSELVEVCGRSEADIIRLVDVFRAPGRSFLMPPSEVPLSSQSMIDLAHESLMRCWTRLITWAGEETAAAEFYIRLSRAAAWHEAGKAGLWRNPELRLAERWREETRPSKAWSARYDDNFAAAMSFLDKSLEEHHRQTAEAARERRAKLRRAQWTAAVLASLLLVAIVLGVIAQREHAQAVTNLALARDAVDESLSSVEMAPASLGADVPALEELRQELLTKAHRFYSALGQQNQSGELGRYDLAMAHLRLGHINRLMHQPEQAAREYVEAVARFQSLAEDFPGSPANRQSLADANNWLGEIYRSQPGRAAEAEQAYNRALELQQALAKTAPDSVVYARQMARTHYNRGILLAGAEGDSARSEADFREAIRLLSAHEDDAQSAQELARAYNNLASLLSTEPDRREEARAFYQAAITIDERLVREHPDNRDYQLELAKFNNNLAALLLELGEGGEAAVRSRRAGALLDALARLAPSLAVEQADAHTLRGHILASSDRAAAEQSYAAALALFEPMFGDDRTIQTPEFHQRFGELLLDLAGFPDGPGSDRVTRLLRRAVDGYVRVCASLAERGSAANIQVAVDNLTFLVPALPADERGRLTASLEQLRRRLPAP